MNERAIELAARLVRESRCIVAITGAGISVPSGIPDFRSDTGLWMRDDPMEIASIARFTADPPRFYRWLRPVLPVMEAAEPNPAHEALAALEHIGALKAVITQNIDGLHQRAGSREVYELHGHLRTITCLSCGRQLPFKPFAGCVRRDEIAYCVCGGLFKPDIVLFDEPLPRGLFWLAQEAIAACDLLIVAGTSLEVAPVCMMPLEATKHGSRLIIVNRTPTQVDSYADAVFHEDVAVVLPAIIESAGIDIYFPF